MTSPAANTTAVPVALRALIFYVALVSPWLRLTAAQMALSVGEPQGSALLAGLISPPFFSTLLPFEAYAAIALTTLLVAPTAFGHRFIVRIGIYLGGAVAVVHLIAWEAAAQGQDTLDWALVWDAALRVNIIALPIVLAGVAIHALWKRVPEQVSPMALTWLLFVLGMAMFVIPGAMGFVMEWTVSNALPAYTRYSAAVCVVAWLACAIFAARASDQASRSSTSAAAR